MKQTRCAVFAEKEGIALGYASLLEPWCASLDTALLDALPQTLEKYDLIIIDFSAKRHAVATVLRNAPQKAKIVLISPYENEKLKTLYPDAEGVDFTLTKPFEISRLTHFVEHQSRSIDYEKMLEMKNSVLAKVVELNPYRIGIFTEHGILFYANNHYLKANSIAMNDIDTITFESISQCNLGFAAIREQLRRRPTHTVQRQENGRWYESHFYRISNGLIVHICQDITQAKGREIQLEQAAIFFEQSNEALMIADKGGKIITVNSAFCRITGYTKDEVVGKTPHILYSGIHDRTFYENMWSSLLHNGAWQGEIWNKRKNGEIYPEWLSINKALSTKYNEEFYISVFTDISSLKETDRKLYFYANHDPLTGLANRINFENQLHKTIESAKRHRSPFALLFIDLDKFKEVNDTSGHAVGDQMLKAVGQRLSASIRAEDFLARLGGDEFVIIAAEINSDDAAAALAYKLLEAIREPIAIDKKVFFMSLSIGIALYPDHALSAEDLIKYADSAMYEVKEGGRNGFLLYHNSIGDKLNTRVQTQHELKTALERDEFELYYQPIIDLRTDRVVGAEALVRWNHPERGLLYPASFIDYVENSDMIYDFGMMVCTKAFADLITIQNALRATEPFSLSINISTKHFFQEGFVAKLADLSHDFGIDPRAIELEVLETQIMKNPQIAQDIFSELHTLGFELALDDFGTGYSSLSYLKLFTLDKLKIDQSFVRDLLIDENDRTITETIITIGKTFGMRVQAEGVETAEHEALLRSMGCDLSQGYYYSRPIPLGAFIEWCMSRG